MKANTKHYKVLLLRCAIGTIMTILAVPPAHAKTACPNTPLSTSPEGPDTPPSPQNLLNKFADLGFSLTQGITGAGATQGTSLAYDRQNHDEGGFKSQFALCWSPAANQSMTTNPLLKPLFVDIDGNFTPGSTQKTASYDIRVQYDRYFTFSPTAKTNPITDPEQAAKDFDNTFFLHTRLGPVWEATQDGHVENELFEFDLRPEKRPYYLDGYNNLFHTTNTSADLEAAVIINATMQAGSNITGRKETVEYDPIRLRVIPDTALQILAPDDNAATKGLGLQSIIFSADDTPYYLPLEGRTYETGKKTIKTKTIYNLFTTSIDFDITKNFALSPSYSTGESAPTFTHTDTVLLTFTIKLGD